MEKQKGNSKTYKFIKNIPLLVLEILLLGASIVFLYVVTVMTQDVKHKDIDIQNITINREVIDKITAKKNNKSEKREEKGYRNIALFGVDSRDGTLGKGNRSDTIIIASINQGTKEIKLISVFRDTYLNLGNDSYNKCNTAFAQGGPEQAINMLNQNLDLAITDYVTIGFGGMIEAVDALGGIEVEITETEISHLNNYQLCMSEEMGIDYIPVEHSGRQVLNGMQATAYCRIRYGGGDDFKRAQRQRNVLIAMMEKAKHSSVTSLSAAATAILPNVETSLSVNEVFSVIGSVASYNVVTSDGFPFENGRAGAKMSSKGACVIPVSLESNVIQLHEMLYPEVEYSPSQEVKDISAEIEAEVVSYQQ